MATLDLMPLLSDASDTLRNIVASVGRTGAYGNTSSCSQAYTLLSLTLFPVPPVHYLLLAFCLPRLQAFQIIDWPGLLPSGSVIFPDLSHFISRVWPSPTRAQPAFHHFRFYPRRSKEKRNTLRANPQHTQMYRNILCR